MNHHKLHVLLVLFCIAIHVLLCQCKIIIISQHDLLRPSYHQKSHIYSLTDDEFRKLYLSSYFPEEPDQNLSKWLSGSKYEKNLPLKVDWREKKVVTAVKSQKSCGACWAFSTSETIESSYAISHNTSVPSLSVQEVIDCSLYNHGCEGGSPCEALRWLSETSIPLVKELSYPLTDKAETCYKDRLVHTSGVKLNKYTCTNAVDTETALLSAIATYGPVIAGVDATTWNQYMGGIIQHHCGEQLNHAIQIVGYDLTGDVPYYIVRNSWGADWGVNGFAYIKIGSNVCGIAKNLAVVLETEAV